MPDAARLIDPGQAANGSAMRRRPENPVAGDGTERRRWRRGSDPDVGRPGKAGTAPRLRIPACAGMALVSLNEHRQFLDGYPVTAGGLSAMPATEGVKGICHALGQIMQCDAPTVFVPGAFRCFVACFLRWRKAGVAICLALAWLSPGQVCQAADEQRTREIVDRVARLFVSQSCIATMEMQITKTDWQRTISMQFWSQGESNILVRIRQPPEDAGTAILKAGNKTWIYLPKANRTVEMPDSMMMTSWMGSHFTLNDLVNQGRLTNDYVISTSFEGQRDGVAVSEYTLTPKPAAAVVWGKITLQVRQADLMPIWERYFDEDGKPVRELSFSDYKTVSTSSRFGRLLPTRLVMRPLDGTHEQTTVTYGNIVFDMPISEATFSPRNLKQ
jgi:outer membrane lipoprotein-sorting protein